MQGRIDERLQHCELCDRFGWHEFCGNCGKRFRGRDLDWRECFTCKVLLTTDFCPLCGREVMSEYLERWESGEIDLEAEERAAKAGLDAMLARKASPQLLRDLYPGKLPKSAEGLVDVVNRGFEGSA